MFKRSIPLLITFVLLISASLPLTQVSSAKGFLSFVPILQVEVDTSALNEEIQPDGKAINVPITVKYRLDVPIFLNKSGPLGIRAMINRWIIYGKFIVPPIKIHLSVINKPDWADISIACPDLYMEITENKFCYANTSLSIAVYKDAPAEVYTLILKADADGVGHVQPQSVEAQFKIKPGYIPLVTINTDQPIREAGPMTTVTFPIKITNNANKETIVKLVDYDTPPGWGVQPSQNQIVIPEGEKATLSLAVTTPMGFGWTPNQIQQIKLKFIVMPSPPSLEYEETSTNTYIYSISVRSGSVPMIGLVGGIIGVVVVLLFVLMRFLKRKS